MTQPQYRKYTTCIKATDYTYPPWPLSILIHSPGSPAVTVTYLIIIAAIVSPLVLLGFHWYLILAIGLDVALIAACNWYLNRRLICLGTNFSCAGEPMPDNQECAIGVIGSPGHSGIFRPLLKGLNASKLGDNDSTIDILLAPGPTTWDNPNCTFTLSDYSSQEPQGYLIAPNPDVVNRGIPYTQSGSDLQYRKYLHCEFEGDGIENFLAFLTLILAALLALLALQVLAPELTALIAFLEILAAVLFGVGLADTLSWDPNPGDPTDISQSLGNLHAGDIVMVSGDWIYDGGHSGWNEIHAVHNCLKIASIIQTPDMNNPGCYPWSWPSDIGTDPDGNVLGLDTPDKVAAARTHFCCAQSGADGAVKGGSTTDPANNWVIHPLVDGCKKPVIIF
jgi:hypothetical protein